MKVRVDPARCCGSGQCARRLPQVFDQDPATGRVVLVDPSPPVLLRPELLDAVDFCPASAIDVHEDDDPF